MNEWIRSFKLMCKQMKGMKDSFLGRMGTRQMEKRKAKMLKQMKKGKIPGMPGF